MGLLPDQLWSLTLREFIWYREGYLQSLKRDWERTSAMMALFANANAAKGKKYNPDDFNPFSQIESQGGQVSSSEEAQALLEKMRKF